MKYQVTIPITTARGEIPTGTILELSETMLAKLLHHVQALPTTKLDCYCSNYGGSCSNRLPQFNYPAECIKIDCEHYSELKPEATKTAVKATNEPIRIVPAGVNVFDTEKRTTAPFKNISRFCK